MRSLISLIKPFEVSLHSITNNENRSASMGKAPLGVWGFTLRMQSPLYLQMYSER